MVDIISAPHWHISGDGKIKLCASRTGLAPLFWPTLNGGPAWQNGFSASGSRKTMQPGLRRAYPTSAHGPGIAAGAGYGLRHRWRCVALGNWNIADHRNGQAVRYLTGCIDEFLMFSRALNDADIERLYAMVDASGSERTLKN